MKCERNLVYDYYYMNRVKYLNELIRAIEERKEHARR